ncbi:helix-turn-helix domain-containing protein [Planosporangium thailandense]|uniref:Helix-turn-helix domain-containing protein n=1 Tax=Planosporangium thailandense TaxID=765197 RepID=A0ABX0XS81_9ACTN|nr:LuxR family transcriptional regulator [Planosporangium thailandense]NJC68139.1 helix-turn-helix domain-containing protein [Planosporangium thailandense]
MSPAGGSGAVVGRDSELEVVRSALADVAAGRGGVVLVEGEPGIGKSALLRGGLADAADLGCQVGWTAADELSPRFPLRLLLDCLDSERARADRDPAGVPAALIGHRPRSAATGGDPLAAAVDRALTIVAKRCTDSPVVLVADDLQWADETSLLAWHRLARTADQVPLLLVGAYRPVPHRAELDALRADAVARGALIRLRPLPAGAVAAVVAVLAGAPAGAGLRSLAEQAAGNPLYLRELVDALKREGAVTVEDGQAELVDGWTRRAPASLTAAIAGRLGFLSHNATTALRVGTLLGPEFSVEDVATVLQLPPSALNGVFSEATAAGVVTAGDRLSFRHPLIRHALYGEMPAAVRSALHRHAAQTLAAAGASVERVAAQLLPAGPAVDGWVTGWLVRAAPELSDRAPAAAADLLERASGQVAVGAATWAELTGALARVRFRLGCDAEAPARRVLTHTDDPVLAAEMRWIIAERLLRAGRYRDALRVAEQGQEQPEVPVVWRARLAAMSARILSTTADDLDAADETAQVSLASARACDDRVAIGYSLLSLSTIALMRRDQAARLSHLDDGLELLADDLEQLELRLLLLGNRTLALSILDRFGEAEQTLAAARDLVDRRTGYAGLARFHAPAAVLHFWTGRWDEALAELDAARDLPDNPRVAPIAAGIVSLIACHRDDRATASARLAKYRDEPSAPAFDVANRGFLIGARAALAERDGQPAQALRAWREVLQPRYAQMERHILMPAVVRAALAVADLDTAREAAELCERDPGRVTPGRAAAVAHCRGLLTGDLDLLASAGCYLRTAGRVVEYAGNCEDVAVLLAQRGERAAAKSALAPAMEVYARLGAQWDLRRAAARVRAFGVRWGARGPRRRPASGWAALSPTEVTIARLVAQGRSNPDIAAELLLSPRTVQSHVSNILGKLKAQSRVEIARAVLIHG